MSGRVSLHDADDALSADHADFVRLFVAHQLRVHAFIRTLIPNAADAEDVLQETSLTGLKKFPESAESLRRSPEGFVTWICTIARFQALKYCRQQKRGRLVFNESLCEQLADRQLQQSDFLDQRRAALAVCVGKLPPRDRTILLHRYGDNYTVSEVSDVLGKPANTIYKALRRIRGALAQCIERRLRTEEHG